MTGVHGTLLGPSGRQAEARLPVHLHCSDVGTLLPDRVSRAVRLAPKHRDTFTMANGSILLGTGTTAQSACSKGKAAVRSPWLAEG